MIAHSVDAWLARTTVDCPSYARRIGRRECAMRREDRDPRCRACSETQEEKMETATATKEVPHGPCARCGKDRPYKVRSRRLCGACDTTVRRRGELHLYPPTGETAGRCKPLVAQALPDTWGEVTETRAPEPPPAPEAVPHPPADDAVRVRAKKGFWLGPLAISHLEGLPGRLWIQHEQGEAGAFPEEEVAEALERYFWERF